MLLWSATFTLGRVGPRRVHCPRRTPLRLPRPSSKRHIGGGRRGDERDTPERSREGRIDPQGVAAPAGRRPGHRGRPANEGAARCPGTSWPRGDLCGRAGDGTESGGLGTLLEASTSCSTGTVLIGGGPT